jgi:hypothetical protein
MRKYLIGLSIGFALGFLLNHLGMDYDPFFSHQDPFATIDPLTTLGGFIGAAVALFDIAPRVMAKDPVGRRAVHPVFMGLLLSAFLGQIFGDFFMHGAHSMWPCCLGSALGMGLFLVALRRSVPEPTSSV